MKALAGLVPGLTTMKNEKGSRKIRVPIRLTLYASNDDIVYNNTLFIKTRVSAIVQERSWKKGHIKITYPLGRDFTNTANFSTAAEFKNYLSSFTEKELIDFLS